MQFSAVQAQNQQASTNSQEVNLTFEINDVKDFLNEGWIRGSEMVHCRGLRFGVDLKVSYFNSVKHLSAFLHMPWDQDDYRYRLKTSYDITLVNLLGKGDKTDHSDHTFGPGNTNIYGNKAFIPLTQLIDPSNGWVVNDSLQVKLHLKCGQLYRALRQY